MIKVIRCAVLLSFLWQGNNGFTQQATPSSNQSHAELASVSEELKESGMDVQVVPKSDPVDPLSPKDSHLTPPSPNSGEKAQLIQFDIQTRTAKDDPYPLETYHGPFFSEDLKVIREQFILKNLPEAKATLERWHQKQDQSFPEEGYFMLAAIYDQLQCYPQALAILENGDSQAQEGKKTPFLLAQSQILRHSGKDEQSLALLSQIPANERTLYPEIFFYQGLSSLYLSHYDQAIINFRKYLSFIPEGAQSSNIRRAVAWLLLARNGQISSGQGKAGEVAGGSGGDSRNPDIEKMLQLLIEKQRATDLETLDESTKTSVDGKSLNLLQKDLEDLEQYSNIAD